ncbi:MAG: hypothetical protein K6G37_00185 [Bacilli bacterium]|nr:hypothetical protein [Bacilli bacterium]
MGKKTKRKSSGIYKEVALGLDPKNAILGKEKDIYSILTSDENAITDMISGVEDPILSVSLFMDSNAVYHSFDNGEHSYICLIDGAVLENVVLVRRVESYVKLKNNGVVTAEYPVLSNDYVVCELGTLTNAIGSSNIKSFKQITEIVTYGDIFRVKVNSKQKVREKVGN